MSIAGKLLNNYDMLQSTWIQPSCSCSHRFDQPQHVVRQQTPLTLTSRLRSLCACDVCLNGFVWNRVESYTIMRTFLASLFWDRNASKTNHTHLNESMYISTYWLPSSRKSRSLYPKQPLWKTPKPKPEEITIIKSKCYAQQQILLGEPDTYLSCCFLWFVGSSGRKKSCLV